MALLFASCGSRLSKHALAPTRGSTRTTVYDPSSAYEYTIPIMEKAVLKIDIQLAVPSGCLLQESSSTLWLGSKP
ncbi:Deoxyuridine 5'-triphosphate nucleotidohydrolase, mitochondrial [Microtus ochrogaster]|uniref:Deoxyuridine 5'-triphosphate nucleotidohydrolase, mitochondrial n=1 Tax=Microtus ochrogaster TaxID=79684 RepID=A0A8J6GCW8_MICOH|nr:Deoxyuridine 5'-triphosphate nucleotidohydrolase, mitochondrial [Microtus ochrogaster]